jgi:hypothetical protein
MFRSIQLQTVGILTSDKLKWQNPHANQVRSMDPFKGFGQNGTDSLGELEKNFLEFDLSKSNSEILIHIWLEFRKNKKFWHLKERAFGCPIAG